MTVCKAGKKHRWRALSLALLVSSTIFIGLGCEPPIPALPETDEACPAGSHENEGGGCASTLSVARTDVAVTPGRDHHVTFVAESGDGPSLYVLGGGTAGLSTLLSDVQRAPLGESGTIDAFLPAGELPEPRAGHTAVVLGEHVVVAGGLTAVPGGLISLATTAIARIMEDGSLGEWRQGPSLPLPVMHHTCNAVGLRMYCVGGRITGNLTASLSVMTELSEEGELALFSTVSPLPQSIGFHQSFVRDGALYVAGGLHRDSAPDGFDRLDEVLRATIENDGTLSPWSSAGVLPFPLQLAAAEVFLDNVYFVGGMDGNDQILDTIVVASFDSDGALTDARTHPEKLPGARMHVHQTPAYGRWLFSVGGRNGFDDSVGTVDVMTFE
jgi:hypothetical protein